jgi:hypothetical protein
VWDTVCVWVTVFVGLPCVLKGYVCVSTVWVLVSGVLYGGIPLMLYCVGKLCVGGTVWGTVCMEGYCVRYRVYGWVLCVCEGTVWGYCLCVGYCVCGGTVGMEGYVCGYCVGIQCVGGYCVCGSTVWMDGYVCVGVLCFGGTVFVTVPCVWWGTCM